MKKCPYCAEEIQDEELQCWNCGEWFDILSPAQQGTVVKPPKKKQSGTDSIDEKTKLGEIWDEYRAPIIGIIIIIALILFAISQKEISNKSPDQTTAIERPKVAAPSAPAPKPALASESAQPPEPTPAPARTHTPAPAPEVEHALAPEAMPAPARAPEPDVEHAPEPEAMPAPER